MGSGAEAVAGDGRGADRARREGRRAQGPAVPAVRRRALRRGAAADGASASRCSTAPRSRARSASRCTWTSSPRCAKAGRGAPCRRGHRRALRAVVEGVHAGDGQGASSTSWRKPTPKNHFTVGIDDDVTHTQPRLRSRRSRPRTPDTVRARVLRPRRRRHGRARTRTRSRSSARRPTTTPRATSSTTRRSRAR